MTQIRRTVGYMLHAQEACPILGFEQIQGFDKVVPPFAALLKFHGGEGFEEVVPLSKTHRNSACLKG